MLKILKNLIKVALISTVLCSCSSIELAHTNIGCIGQPDISINLTESEIEQIPESADEKIFLFVLSLRERINAQCRINAEHDRLFNHN